MVQDRIKEIRKRMGLTQEEFAQTLGMTISSVARWENGGHKPSKVARMLIRRVFEEYCEKHREIEKKYDPLDCQ
uniref:Putative DNA binding, helix-turn-helix domain containing protein n=1 Tax=viral metagenome TaxID=1070528 RepID=A0A6H1Z9L7_9ZZZZ